MQIKLTTLNENTAAAGVLAEFGLSILVEADGQRILMDTGRWSAAATNAEVLGIDLHTVDRIVISHGHHDHTGGLLEVLRRTGPKEIVAHPDIFQPKYVKRKGENERHCGLPYTREALESAGARFRLSREHVQLSEHVMTTGEVPMATGYEQIEPDFYIKGDNTLVPDPLADDLSLVIDADFGLVVIAGCAHRGIVNHVRRAMALTGKDHVYAVIGGTHLLRSNEDRVSATASELMTFGVQKLGVSHCTGFYASAQLAREFGDRFFLNNSGAAITLP